jgi:hypothetical protein
LAASDKRQFVLRIAELLFVGEFLLGGELGEPERPDDAADR